MRVEKKPQQGLHCIKSCSLQSLPPEIKALIFAQLPDFAALRAISLTSQDLNDVRRAHQHQIVSKILFNVLGVELIREALCRVDTSEILLQRIACPRQRSDYSGLQRFISKRTDIPRRHDIPKRLPWAMLRKMVVDHHTISRLAEKFRKWAFGHAPSLHGIDIRELALSSIEQTRIHRAFYRYQMYCDLFSENFDYNQCAQSPRMFAAFPPWEVEEIACIRKFIYDQMAVVFRDVMATVASNPPNFIITMPWEERPSSLPANTFWLEDDLMPSWFESKYPGGFNLRPDNFLYRAYLESSASFGIAWLDKVLGAPSCADRLNAFRKGFNPNEPNKALVDTFKLTDALMTVPPRLQRNCPDIESYFHGDPDPFIEDHPDRFNAAWAWANKNKFQPLHQQPGTRKLCKWGYVMWDKSRLERLGVLETTPPEIEIRGELEDVHQVCSRRDPGVGGQANFYGLKDIEDENFVVDQYGYPSDSD
ncbi:MAG: hypothetical protein Q9227_005521 [Pyrenula ochraceoflavens]